MGPFYIWTKTWIKGHFRIMVQKLVLNGHLADTRPDCVTGKYPAFIIEIESNFQLLLLMNKYADSLFEFIHF